MMPHKATALPLTCNFFSMTPKVSHRSQAVHNHNPDPFLILYVAQAALPFRATPSRGLWASRARRALAPSPVRQPLSGQALFAFNSCRILRKGT